MPSTIAQIRAKVDLLIQDGANKLPTATREDMVRKGIVQRYSQDRPQELVSELTGDGTAQFTLPATFEDGFSVVRQIEYPLGSVPPDLLEDDDWQLYRTPTGLKLRLLNNTPGAGEKLWLTFTARHAADASTVPDSHVDAVCDLSAALCLEALAAFYAQTGDSTISADLVNWRTKSGEYLGLAKAAWKRYFAALGIEAGDNAASGSGTGAAIAIGDLDNVMGSGVDRLTHGRRSR